MQLFSRQSYAPRIWLLLRFSFCLWLKQKNAPITVVPLSPRISRCHTLVVRCVPQNCSPSSVFLVRISCLPPIASHSPTLFDAYLYLPTLSSLFVLPSDRSPLRHGRLFKLVLPTRLGQTRSTVTHSHHCRPANQGALRARAQARVSLPAPKGAGSIRPINKRLYCRPHRIGQS